MPVTKVRALGGRGVVTDIPAVDLPMDAFSDARNVRFVANRAEKMGGYFPSLKNGPDKTPALGITQEPNSANIIYGTAENVFRVQGVNHIKINANAHPTYQASPEDQWSFCTLSGVLVMNNGVDNPQGWQPNLGINVDEKLVDLPGWGKPSSVSSDVVDWKARRIRSYKNYLVAIHMTEPGDGLTGAQRDFPHRIRWSDISEVNAFPPNWYQDSPTSDGGFLDLSDCEGELQEGLPLRENFILYTNRETYIMQFIGGDLVFSVNKLFPDTGVINQNCVTVFEGAKHFVVAEEDIFVHDGSSRQSIATDIVKERVIGNILQTNYRSAKVIAYPDKKEIWICYNTKAKSGDPMENYACNEAAVWNWIHNTWTFTEIPDGVSFAFLVPPEADARTWNNPNAEEVPPVNPTGDEYRWNGDFHKDELWDRRGYNYANHALIASSSDAAFYTCDQGTTQQRLGGQATPVVAELMKYSIAMADLEPSLAYHKTMRTFYPLMQGTGTVQFRLGGSSDPYNPPAFRFAKDFTIGQEQKVDCFINDRYLAFHLIDVNEGKWSLSGYDLDYFLGGNR